MRSTIGQLMDFKEGFIWADITDELEVWLKQIHQQLENHGMASDHRMLDRLGGSAEAIRNFEDIIDTLIDLSENKEVEDPTMLNKLTKGR